MGGCGLDPCDFGLGSLVGFCEHDNEPSGSIKARKYLTNRGSVSLSRRTVLHRVGMQLERLLIPRSRTSFSISATDKPEFFLNVEFYFGKPVCTRVLVLRFKCAAPDDELFICLIAGSWGLVKEVHGMRSLSMSNKHGVSLTCLRLSCFR
jgi:hypothetical protein